VKIIAGKLEIRRSRISWNVSLIVGSLPALRGGEGDAEGVHSHKR